MSGFAIEERAQEFADLQSLLVHLCPSGRCCFLLSNYIKNNAILADVIPTPFDQANERMTTCLVAPENFFH
jgi:hypothetical protein